MQNRSELILPDDIQGFWWVFSIQNGGLHENFFLLAQKSFAFLYFDCSGVTVFFGGPPNAFLGAAGALGFDGANWMPAGFDAGAGVGFAAGLAPPPKENGDDFAGAGAGVGFAAGLLLAARGGGLDRIAGWS